LLVTFINNNNFLPTIRRGRSPSIPLGGINHCSLHRRLAKFRDLMIEENYSAVIGYDRVHVCAPTLNYRL